MNVWRISMGKTTAMQCSSTPVLRTRGAPCSGRGMSPLASVCISADGVSGYVQAPDGVVRREDSPPSMRHPPGKNLRCGENYKFDLPSIIDHLVYCTMSIARSSSTYFCRCVDAVMYRQWKRRKNKSGLRSDPYGLLPRSISS